MTEQYDGYDTVYENVSQCNITFNWFDNSIYDTNSWNNTYKTAQNFEKLVEKRLEKGLANLGMCLEGLSFQSIE